MRRKWDLRIHVDTILSSVMLGLFVCGCRAPLIVIDLEKLPDRVPTYEELYALSQTQTWHIVPQVPFPYTYHPGAISPDGNFLASSEGNGITIWNRQGVALRTFCPSNGLEVEHVQFSPSGKVIAAKARGQQRTFLCSLDGRVVATIPPDCSTSVVSSAITTPPIFLSKAPLLAVPEVADIHRPGSLNFWDFSGRKVSSIQGMTRDTKLALFRDDRGVAGYKSDLRFSNRSGEPLWEMEVNSSNPILASSDGRHFAQECYVVNGTEFSSVINIYDLQTRTIKTVRFPTSFSFNSAVYDASGKVLVAVWFLYTEEAKKALQYRWALTIISNDGRIQTQREILVSPGTPLGDPRGPGFFIPTSAGLQYFYPDGRLVPVNTQEPALNTFGRDVTTSPGQQDVRFATCVETPSGGSATRESSCVRLSESGGIERIWTLKGRVFGEVQEGRRVLLQTEDGTYQLRDREQGLLLSLPKERFASLLSPDGRVLVSGYSAGQELGILLWREGVGTKTLTRRYHLAMPTAFTPDSKYVVFDTMNTSAKSTSVVLDSTTGDVVDTYRPNFRSVSSRDLSLGNGKVLFWELVGVLPTRSEIRMWDFLKRKVTTVYAAPSGVNGSFVSASSQGKYLAIKTQSEWTFEGLLGLYDVETKTLKEVIPSGAIGEPVFANNDRLLACNTANGVAIVNIKTTNVVYFVCSKTQWLLYTPDGYFDCSKRGAQLVAEVKGLKAFSIDQFAARNNRPDIILERLGLGSQEIVDHLRHQHERRLQKLGLREDQLTMDADAPEAVIEEVRQEGTSATVKFRLQSEARPLKSYNILANGVPVFGARGRGAWGSATSVTERVELVGGRNRLEVECLNEAGARSVRPFEIVENPHHEKGRLYFLGFGVSEYADRNLDLKYADRDVVTLARTVQASAAPVFSEVHVATYTNRQVTVEAIAASKRFLADARPNDAVILFIAGHGLHDRDRDATYYFLTHEASLTNLAHTAADFGMIEDLLMETQARRKVFLIDTCESGEMDERETIDFLAQATARGIRARSVRGITTKQEVPGEVRRSGARKYLLDRNRLIYADLTRRSGAIVFSSCRGNELSYESDQTKHGFFTNEIVEGLKGAADGNRDRVVTIDELLSFVSSSVGEKTGGIQNPTIDLDNAYQMFSLPVAQ